MGKRGRNHGKGKGGDGPKKPRDDVDARERSGWKPGDAVMDPLDVSWMHNASFDAYYRENLKGVLRDDKDWDAFYAAVRTPLPTTFRVVATSLFANRVRETLKGHWQKVFGKDGVKIHSDEWGGGGASVKEGESRPQMMRRFVEDVVHAPSPLGWYPAEGDAWYFSASRRGLKKAHELRDFHEYVKAEDSRGNISRQEAVSMIPVELLQVEPHHNVLDMCAAPGSKTQQILEKLYVHGTAGNPESAWSAGMIVANDSDTKRCFLLSHQTQRIHCPNLVVTNLDASQFPTLSSTGAPGGPPLLFDRILCDVPCTGDGTLRKSSDIWRWWSPAGGNGMHKLQVQIAMRGLALLKVGGLMVYSTCSFNPVENEAVIAELLRQYGEDAVEIVDSSAVLPGLVTRPGIREWKVWTERKGGSKKGAGEEKGEASEAGWGEYESVKDRMSKKGDGVYTPSMWPSESAKSGRIPLHLCRRLMPHDSDTGGFFIVLLRKLKEAVPSEVSARASLNIRKQSDVERDLPVGRSVLIIGINRFGLGSEACRKVLAGRVAQYGTVEQIFIPESHQNSPKNIAVVVYSTAEEAQAFIRQGESFTEAGKELYVKPWHPEERKAADAKQASVAFLAKMAEEKEAKGRDPPQEGEIVPKKRVAGGVVEPIHALGIEENVHVARILETFYGLEGFPFDRCILRGEISGSKAKSRFGKVLLTSESLYKILTGFEAHRLRVIVAGVCVFSKDGGQNPLCHHKLAHESMHIVYPFLRKRVVTVDAECFRRLCDEKIVLQDSLPEGSLVGTALESVLGTDPGCFAVLLDPDVAKRAGITQPVVIPVHRGRTRFTTLIADKDIKGWLDYVEDIFRKAGLDIPERKGISKEAPRGPVKDAQ